MRAVKDTIDDLIGTPAILLFIFVVLPFFMIFVPYMTYAFVKENLLFSLPVIALLILGGYALKRFQRRKA